MVSTASSGSPMPGRCTRATWWSRRPRSPTSRRAHDDHADHAHRYHHHRRRARLTAPSCWSSGALKRREADGDSKGQVRGRGARHRAGAADRPGHPAGPGQYAGASGDFNVIHWNERVATSVGLPNVIANGMYTMAEAGRFASDWAGRPRRGGRVRRAVLLPGGFIAGHNNAEAIAVTSPGFANQPQQVTTGTNIASIAAGVQVLVNAGAVSFTGNFGTAMYWASGVATFKAAT